MLLNVRIRLQKIGRVKEFPLETIGTSLNQFPDLRMVQISTWPGNRQRGPETKKLKSSETSYSGRKQKALEFLVSGLSSLFPNSRVFQFPVHAACFRATQKIKTFSNLETISSQYQGFPMGIPYPYPFSRSEFTHSATLFFFTEVLQCKEKVNKILYFRSSSFPPNLAPQLY